MLTHLLDKLSAYVEAGQFYKHNNEVFYPNKEGTSGHTGTQDLVELSANCIGDLKQLETHSLLTGSANKLKLMGQIKTHLLVV